MLTDTHDIGATIQQIGHVAFGCTVGGGAVSIHKAARPLTLVD